MCTHMSCKCGTSLKVIKSSPNFGEVEPCKKCSKKGKLTDLETLQEAFDKMDVVWSTEESFVAIYLYPEIDGINRIAFNKSGSWRNELQVGGC
jgi:hypothetical protein